MATFGERAADAAPYFLFYIMLRTCVLTIVFKLILPALRGQDLLRLLCWLPGIVGLASWCPLAAVSAWAFPTRKHMHAGPSLLWRAGGCCDDDDWAGSGQPDVRCPAVRYSACPSAAPSPVQTACPSAAKQRLPLSPICPCGCPDCLLFPPKCSD